MGFAASRAALLLVETLMDCVWDRRGRPAAAGPSAVYVQTRRGPPAVISQSFRRTFTTSGTIRQPGQLDSDSSSFEEVELKRKEKKKPVGREVKEPGTRSSCL